MRKQGKLGIVLIIVVCFLAVATFYAYSQEGTSPTGESKASQKEGAVPEEGKTSVADINQAQKEADADLANAKAEAAEREQAILADRAKLAATVKEMEKEKKALAAKVASYEARYKENDLEIERMNKRLAEVEGDADEITGSVRGIAQDLRVLIRQSMVSAETQGREKVLDPLVSETEFPSLENIQKMADLMFDEIRRNGGITTTSLPFMDETGRETKGEITRIGTFNAIFQKEGEVGYLEYSPAKQGFHQLAVTLPGALASEARDFAGGKAQGLYVDMSAGGALRQLTDMPTWTDEIKAGGILIYPILGLGVLALLLVIERLFVLFKERRAAESLAKSITPHLEAQDWKKAEETTKGEKSTLALVLGAGIRHREEKPEVIETVIEEEIQSVMPRLERNMRFLQIMAMVAPLMGLLGTVTGMITTFQMITLYGTGDPKMMAGGISEALVTTMYGLVVAIPIMLVHGYLGSLADRILGTLEEKSIMLLNIIRKTTVEA